MLSPAGASSPTLGPAKARRGPGAHPGAVPVGSNLTSLVSTYMGRICLHLVGSVPAIFRGPPAGPFIQKASCSEVRTSGPGAFCSNDLCSTGLLSRRVSCSEGLHSRGCPVVEGLLHRVRPFEGLLFRGPPVQGLWSRGCPAQRGLLSRGLRSVEPPVQRSLLFRGPPVQERLVQEGILLRGPPV